MPIDKTKIEEFIAHAEGEADLHLVIAAMHESHRRRQHCKAKECQPPTDARLGCDDSARILGEAFKPLTDEDRSYEGNEYLCRTVADCLVAGDLGDILYALIRVWRKQWAWQPHLPPIEEAGRLLAMAAKEKG